MFKRTIGALGVALVLGLLIITPTVYALAVSGDAPGVAASETINDDLFAAGQEVVIDGIVNGDVYAAATTITVNGIINGDLIAAAETITITGTVTDDVRLAAATVLINKAKIGDSVSLLAENVTSNEGSIGGGMLFAAGNVTLRTPVERGLTGAVDTLTVDNKVGKDINVAVSHLRLQANAAVGGNVTYRSDTDAVVQNGAQVQGEVTRKDAPASSAPSTESFGFKLWQFLAALVIGALMLKLMPKTVEGAKNIILSKPAKSMGVGLVALLISVPLFILLMVTVVGIPLALIYAVAFGVALYLAKIFVAYTASEWSVKKLNVENRNPYLLLTLGLAAYFALSTLAWIGGWVVFLTLITGLGGLLMQLNAARQTPPASKKPSKKKA